jgi:hypothetical protein
METKYLALLPLRSALATSSISSPRSEGPLLNALCDSRVASFSRRSSFKLINFTNNDQASTLRVPSRCRYAGMAFKHVVRHAALLKSSFRGPNTRLDTFGKLLILHSKSRRGSADPSRLAWEPDLPCSCLAFRKGGSLTEPTTEVGRNFMPDCNIILVILRIGHLCFHRPLNILSSS